MHELDADHSVSIGGHLAYKDTDPPTDVNASDINSLWRGLLSISVQEGIGGDLLAADGATDQSEGWVRLSKAIRRAANRPVTGSIVIAGSSVSPTLDKDAFAFAITESGGAHVDGIVYIDQANPGYNDRRVIIVYNASTSAKRVYATTTPGDKVVTLQPGQAVMLYGRSGSGETDWEVIGGQPQNGSFSVDLIKDGVTVMDTRVLHWFINGKIATIVLPNIQAVGLGPTSVLEIKATGGGPLPAFLDSANGYDGFIARVYNAGVIGVGAVLFSGSAGSRTLLLNSPTGTTFGTGVGGVVSCSFSYPLL